MMRSVFEDLIVLVYLAVAQILDYQDMLQVMPDEHYVHFRAEMNESLWNCVYDLWFFSRFIHVSLQILSQPQINSPCFPVPSV